MPIIILASAITVFFSFIGMVTLFSFSKKLVGDSFSKIIKLTVWGIFFAALIPSVVELLEELKIMNEAVASPLMSLFLTAGSICFAFAGYTGLKIIKD